MREAPFLKSGSLDGWRVCALLSSTAQLGNVKNKQARAPFRKHKNCIFDEYILNAGKMQTSFLEIVTEKVQHGAHLTDGGRGVKSYLGNAQLQRLLFIKGLPQSGFD